MIPADDIIKHEDTGTAKASGGRSKQPEFSPKEEITPEIAARMLETAFNPVEDKKAIARYAEAMKNGAWILNGQPIIFDENGKLIDGVQRLHACIQADTPFSTMVARNVRADTLHTIDQHRRRSYQGVLESRGVRNPGKVVRTMSKLIRIENGSLGREVLPISWSRYDRVLDANPEIVEACEIGRAGARVPAPLHCAPGACLPGFAGGSPRHPCCLSAGDGAGPELWNGYAHWGAVLPHRRP